MYILHALNCFIACACDVSNQMVTEGYAAAMLLLRDSEVEELSANSKVLSQSRVRYGRLVKNDRYLSRIVRSC